MNVKMVMIRRLPLPILAGLLASAGLSHAQTIPSPYRYVDERQAVSLVGGYMVTDDGTAELGPESAPVAGVRYSIRLGGPFDAEASVAYLPTTRAVWDTVAVGEELRRVGEADFSLVSLAASLRFNVTGPRTYHGLMPYVLAGGGVVTAVSDDDAIEEASEIAPSARFDFGTRFAGLVGAGIEWFATRRLAIRADARDVFWKLPTPEAFRRQRLDLPQEEWVQNFEFSLGAAYHF